MIGRLHGSGISRWWNNVRPLLLSVAAIRLDERHSTLRPGMEPQVLSKQAARRARLYNLQALL